VLLAPPADKKDIKTEIIPGLKPFTDSTREPDATQGITVPLPMKSAPPPATSKPTPKPKG
jgi:hypothetical protein